MHRRRNLCCWSYKKCFVSYSPGEPVKCTQIRFAHLDQIWGGCARKGQHFNGGEIAKVAKRNVDTVLEDDGKLCRIETGQVEKAFALEFRVKIGADNQLINVDDVEQTKFLIQTIKSSNASVKLSAIQ